MIIHNTKNGIIDEEVLAEDPQQADDQDSEPEPGTPITPPTADDIVSASLSSGALLTVCDIDLTTTAREDKEEACIQDFVVKGCGCDVGPNRSQCSRLFPVEHYQSFRSTFAELSHDELDLIVMGQVMAHTFQSTTLVGHRTASPAVRRITYTAVLSSRSPCVQADHPLHLYHREEEV